MQIMRTHFVLESGMPAQRVEPMVGDKEYLQVRAHSQAAGQLLEKADGSFTVAAGMMLLILIIRHSTCQSKPQMRCLVELFLVAQWLQYVFICFVGSDLQRQLSEFWAAPIDLLAPQPHRLEVSLLSSPLCK